MKRIWLRVRHVLADRLWVRPAIASVFSAALALAAVLIDSELTGWLPLDVSNDTLVNLLSMIATSMLTVATFSVAAIVTAVTAVSQATTPRVTRMILADSTVQNVLASFISVFIYAIVAIFALEALPYGSAGRVTLFLGLVAMIVWVLVSFLRWVDHVTQLGRVGTAIDRTSAAALGAVREDTIGTFGAAFRRDGAPADGHNVRAATVGYVIAIDVGALNDVAEQLDATIELLVRPGALVDTVAPVARVRPVRAVKSHQGETGEDGGNGEEIGTPGEAIDRISEAIQIEGARSTDNDPRFGLVILGETAAKALSPGVNDPGTAIGIMTALLTVFTQIAKVRRAGPPDVCYPRVVMPVLSVAGLLDDAFTAIARDGAGSVEVGIRLQKTMQGLARLGDPEIAREAERIGELGLELARKAPLARDQIERIAHECRLVPAAGDPTRLAARRAGEIAAERLKTGVVAAPD